MMKISKIETLYFKAVPHVQWEREHSGWPQALPENLWVRVHSDDGLIGLGETYYNPRAVGAIVHDLYSPLLLGRDPFDIENHWNNMFSLANFRGFAGAEMRAISAIDMALWDLQGQYLGQPIYNLLGGRSRERVPVYNTCRGYGRHDDNIWWHGRAGELAQDLLRQGIRAMKIWPFDRFGPTLAGPGPESEADRQSAVGPLGHHLGNEDLRQGLAVVEDIRRAVGDKMAIAIEGHARWDLPTAVQIARALEPLDIMWLEEIMPPDNAEAYARLKAQTRIPICQSERVFTRFGFRPFIEQNAADIIMPDIAWCGGLTETRKISSFADTYYLPITTHDCTGPVTLFASAHLMLHIPNGKIAECVRGYYDGGWYDEVVTNPIRVRDGFLTLDHRPGLGTALREEFLRRPDARIEQSA
jgi:galactonate dehydratase